MSIRSRARLQAGLTYIEVMVAAMLIAIALVPAMDALQTGILAARIFESSSSEHYAVLARMEEVLAEPFTTLTAAAATAGNPKTPGSYSDAPGTRERRLVYLGLYDADNADGDNDVFTVLDPDLDGDKNPYTGYSGLLWVRVEVEDTVLSLESLTSP